MKKTVFTGKRAAGALLALTLLFALCAAAFAAAPVLKNSGAARPVSLFLSNFIETGLAGYGSDTPDATVAAAVLKHIEINAAQYAEGVTVYKDAEGQQFMKISAEKFEQRAEDMFSRSVKASACPGYADGAITVTADGAFAPVNIIATPDEAPAIRSDGYYQVDFTVFSVAGGVSDDMYGYTSDVPSNRATAVATGRCVFEYTGRADVAELSIYDLAPVSFETSGAFSPVTGALGDNLPYPSGGSAQSGGAKDVKISLVCAAMLLSLLFAAAAVAVIVYAKKKYR